MVLLVLMRFSKICIYIYLLFVFVILSSGSAVLGFCLAQTVIIKEKEQFSKFNPALPTRILDIRGDLITEFSSNEKREMIKFNQLPPALINALLAREDRSFYDHGGFTVKAIFRAVIGKLTGRKLGGGSTITQQIAGLLYCDRTNISIKRKIRELWWAIQMERRYSKDEIMELYLNKVYFGEGTYGVSAASQFYFGHSVGALTPAEAAVLVIQLSNPAYYNPFEHPNRIQERQAYVLSEMVKLGYLTEEEKNQSYEDYWTHFDYTRTKSSVWFNRQDNARWFSEYVRRELETMMYGTMDLYSDGYIVNTTCDLRHQAAAERVMTNSIRRANKRVKRSLSHRFTQSRRYSNITALISLAFNIPSLHIDSERVQAKTLAYYRKKLNPIIDMSAMLCGVDSLKIMAAKSTAKVQDELAKKTVEGTLICLENNTGYITALVGGSKFDQSNQIIRATQGHLQPGSSFKPLLYSAAIDTKLITAATVLEDTPQVFKNQSEVPYIPNNYAGHWRGTTLACNALAHSLNIPAIKVLDTIGFDATINRAALLLDITDQDEIDRTFPRLYPLALGVISVAPIQMAKAFACFANQGRKVDPIAIRTIENRNGTIIMDPERDLRLEQRREGSRMQLISPQNAYIMTSMLQKTVTGGTLSYAAGYGSKFRYKDSKTGSYFTMPFAGKTGTTQNWSDVWTIGFSPYYTAAVWFGYDKGNQSLGLEHTGATLAGPAWGNYMQEIHKEKPYKSFLRPETGLITASVCKKSGLLPTSYCDDGTVTLPFLSGTAPAKQCAYHEANNDLLEIAKDRFRKSGYRAGQIPVELNEKAVFIDPRIYEDPEPKQKRWRRRYKHQRSHTAPSTSSENVYDDTIFDTDSSDNVTQDNTTIDFEPDNTLNNTPETNHGDALPDNTSVDFDYENTDTEFTPETTDTDSPVDNASQETADTADSSNQAPNSTTETNETAENTEDFVLPTNDEIKISPEENPADDNDGIIQGEETNPWL